MFKLRGLLPIKNTGPSKEADTAEPVREEEARESTGPSQAAAHMLPQPLSTF